LNATRKETDADVLSAKRHVKARIGQTKATNDLTVATDTGTGSSKKATKAAQAEAAAAEAAAKAKEEQEKRLTTFTSSLQKVKNELDATRKAQKD